MGDSTKVNSFNIYKMIARHDTPASLLSTLADIISPLPYDKIFDRKIKGFYGVAGSKEGKLEELKDENNVYRNYLYFFQKYGFYK